MKKFILSVLLVLLAWPALAQNPQCPTRPAGDSTNACASTAFVQSAFSGLVPLTVGHIFIGNGSNVATDSGGVNSIVSAGVGGLASFTNIITGQNYNATMTNSGEAYGYSFRNSTTTGNAIYGAIFPGISTQDGMQSVLNIPATATVTQGTAIAAYFDNNVAVSGGARNGVGLFSAGRCRVDSSACWGINTLLQDATTRTIGAGTGRILVNELDFNVMNPLTQVIGLSIGGNSLAQSTNAIGFIANSLGTGMKWQTGFYCIDAAVSNNCMVAGPSVASGTSSPSTKILQQYFDSGSVKRTMTMQSSDNVVSFTNDQANLVLSLGGAGSVQGSINLNGSTSGTVSIAPGGAVAGTVNFLLPVTNGTTGQFLTSGGGSGAMTWVSGLTTTVVVTCGTLTFTGGLLTNKGAC